MATANMPPGAVPTNGMADPFASSPSPHANPAPFRYAAFDNEQFSLAATNSPSSARRALEAHLKNTDRRIHEASRLGTTLIQQRKDLAARLKEVEQMQIESEVPDDLRQKLSELEREYHEVGRESARAFLPKSRVASEANDPSAGSGIISGSGRDSPTKAQAPSMSRRQRNQPANRVHDIEFATEISTSLIAQVRQLQAALAEKDDELKDATAAKALLEAEAAHLVHRLRHMDENEQKYKDENWNLETRLQDMEASLRESMDKESRLVQTLKSTQTEKATKERELDDLKVSHEKLNEDHAMAKKVQEADLHGLKRDAAVHETEKSKLERRIAELVAQNTELARAVSYRMNQSAQQSETDFVSAEEGIQSDEQSPLDSAPPSPIKGTPARHGMLEQETLKSSLNHAHRMIQNLKNTIHREKTEKIELKRMLQDARDELETRRESTGIVGANMAKKRRSEPEGVKFKRPSTSRLGATRTSMTEILEDEPDWEDHDLDHTPSKPRSVGVATGAAALGAAGMDGYDHAYGRSEDDSPDAFDTAHERDTTTESEAFATGKEDFGEDTDGDLTETERNTNNTLRSVGSFTSRPKAEHRRSYMSTASMSGDDDDDDVVRTPVQNAQQPKYKLRLSRGVRRSGRVSNIIADSPSAASNSPASSNGTPQRAQQTLGDELDALDEDSMEGTPSSSFVMDDEGSPITQREVSMESGTPTKSEHESVAMLGNEGVVRKPDMVDSAMMTEPWEPERIIEERVIEKEVRVEVPVHDSSLRDHAADVKGGALAGLGVGRLMGAHHDNACEVDDAGQSTVEASHEDLTPVSTASNEIDLPLSQSRAVEAGLNANETGLKGLAHGENHTQVHLPAVADARDDEIEKYKAQIAEINKSHEDQIEKHKSELRQAQQAREAEIEKIKSAVKQEQNPHDAEVQKVTSQMQQLQVSYVAEFERASAEIKQLQNARAAEVEKYRTELTQANQSRDSEQQSYRKEVEALKQQGVEASQAIAQLKLDHNRQLQHFKGLVNEISEKLTVAEQERDDLQQNHVNVTSQFNDLSRQHAQVQSRHAQMELEKEQLKQEHFNSNTEFEHLKRQFMEMQSKHAQAQETIRTMTPGPVNFAFSDLIAQDMKPVETEQPEEPDFPLVPRRSSKRPDCILVDSRGQQEQKTLLTDKYHDYPLAATDEDEENVPNESPVDTASFPRPPLAEKSTNTPPSRPPPSVPTADEGSQTLVSGKDIDDMLRNKTAVVPAAPASRDADNSLSRNAAVSGAANAAAVGSMPPVTTPSRDRSAEVRPSIYESPTLKQPRRPSSSGSMRAKGATGAPPLPADHTKKIAEAQRAPGAPTGQTSVGTMGPPVMPASAYKWPTTRDRSTNERVGSRDSTTPRPVQTRASRSQMASDRVSHRTSVSSFASELDERFNITRGHGVYPDDITPPTDPRMIQAITQTMIGEYLWKYTRKAGRSETSNTRHRRFFWVHPYTRTLYWSEQDPSTAGKNMLKAKSVAIDYVRVITDDNAYPPGLHRKSLVVVTPGREIVFTAPTAQRHETWFNALSYLLLRTDKEKGETEDTFDGSDVDEFRPGFGRSVRRSISKMTGQHRSSSRQSRDQASLSSYNSRTTRNTSPQRQDADRTITNRYATVTQQSKSLQPPTSNNGLTSTVSNNSRQSSGIVGGRFTSLASRFRPSSSGRSGSALSNRRDNLDPASIYDASVVADSAEDLRAIIEQQEKQVDRLEDVRACCDGRHHVGSLSRANGRHSHGHHSHSHRH